MSTSNNTISNSITISTRTKRLFSQTETSLKNFTIACSNAEPFYYKRVNISAAFFELKKEAYQELTGGDSFSFAQDMKNHIIPLLSLYSIIKVEANLASKYKECPGLEVLCEYRRYLRMKKWGPPKRFPQALKNEIEDLISDLSDNDFDDILEFQEKIGDMKKKTNCKAAKRLLQFTCCLVDNLVESLKKVGEMELQTSIVHTLMLQLFKLNKGYNPYSSNLVFDKNDACLKGVRPDYLVVVNGDYKNVVGEVKPAGSSKSSLEWDLLRLGVFGRQMLETEGLKAIVCFQVIGNNIDFYIMSSQNDIFFLTHVESVTIPLFYRNFSSLPSQMNSLYNIMSLYENLCQKNTTPSTSSAPAAPSTSSAPAAPSTSSAPAAPSTSSVPVAPSTSSAPAVHSPFPSFDMIKNLYNDNKKQKVCP